MFIGYKLNHFFNFCLNFHSISQKKPFLSKIRESKKERKIITPCVTAVVQELMGKSLHGTGNCAVDLLNLSGSNEHSTKGQSSEYTT